jgi:hypothetical protein
MRQTMLRALLLGAAVLLGTAPLRAATLPELRIFIEFNETGQDVGVHTFLDGEWKVLKIFDPRGREIFHVQGTGNLGGIGLSELFVEGEEPSLADLPLDEFFELFPEGTYTVLGRTPDGAKIKRQTTFSHQIPAAPVVLSPSPTAPVDRNHMTVSWQPVTSPAGVVIIGYEVIVDGSSLRVGPGTTSLGVPPEIIDPGTAHKFEVISIANTRNQSITEGSFTTTN